MHTHRPEPGRRVREDNSQKNKDELAVILSSLAIALAFEEIDRVKAAQSEFLAHASSYALNKAVTIAAELRWQNATSFSIEVPLDSWWGWESGYFTQASELGFEGIIVRMIAEINGWHVLNGGTALSNVPID
jgi:hypothetical protein